MDLEYTEAQKMLRDAVRRFLEREVAPLIDDCEQRHQFPKDLIKKLLPFGCVGALIPQEYGGHALDYISLGILMEEAGRVWGSLRIMLNAPLNLIPYTIYVNGTEEQRRRFLPALLAGEATPFLAITEPNVGSDVSAVETTAQRRGDSYVINGTKMWISNGSAADFGIVFASTDRSKGAGGISAFIVERARSPYGARDIDKMFAQAVVASELTFEDCKVPLDNLLGQEGQGLKIALTTLNQGRYSVAMGSTGIAQACLDASTRYAQERRQFGRPIASFQLVQKLIVDMACDTMAARLLSLQAGLLLEKGGRCERECSIAKLFATEVAFRVASNALQVHGSYGYSKEFPIERYFRDARGATIPEGTSEIQTLIIGRDILGMSAIR